MIHDSRFIIIAGTARNVGKTTLACRIIHENRLKNIVALKFITIKREEANHHHKEILTYLIEQEVNLVSNKANKDTVRMLRSGANSSYLVVSNENYIEEAIKDILKRLDSDTIVVAESATLRKYIKPFRFIIVDREDAVNRKEYIKELYPLSDYFIDNILNNQQINSIINLA